MAMGNKKLKRRFEMKALLPVIVRPYGQDKHYKEKIKNAYEIDLQSDPGNAGMPQELTVFLDKEEKTPTTFVLAGDNVKGDYFSTIETLTKAGHTVLIKNDYSGPSSCYKHFIYIKKIEKEV